VLPVLYWMLECSHCGGRRVVRDMYRLPTRGSVTSLAGGGFDGPALEERYHCLKGCAARVMIVASVLGPWHTTMWIQEPYEPLTMTLPRRAEWLWFIAKARMSGTLGGVRRAPKRR
jgi:hypothetical protein